MSSVPKPADRIDGPAERPRLKADLDVRWGVSKSASSLGPVCDRERDDHGLED